MPHPIRRRCLAASLAATLLACSAAPCLAIEMFTFFGDGSRIGLPSLEVPVEAYPGIPLRSDRIRARRRASRTAPAQVIRGDQASLPGGITLRAAPTPRPVQVPPLAPEPDDVLTQPAR